jgi:CobQ-like glutamine amidotransferase family enzyme
MSTFTIARLVPRMLGLNGSSRNASVLASYLKHSGHTIEIVDVDAPGDAPAQVDAVCVGSGSASTLRPAATLIIPLVRVLAQWRTHGAHVVAVGTGWDLLGHTVTTPEGEVLPGAGILPSHSDHGGTRFSGEVAGVDYQGRASAGYVNQVGHVKLEDGAKPLMEIDAPESGYPREEGLVGDNVFATRVGGPAFALNPHWCEDVASSLLQARGETLQRTEFHSRIDHAAREARRLIEARLGVARS